MLPRLPGKLVLIVFCLLAGLLLPACARATSSARQPVTRRPWAPADLRFVGAREGVEPALQILAVYLRPAGRDWQIRLDLLEMEGTPQYDLYLALDTSPGGSTLLPVSASSQVSWDALLVIPAAGSIGAYAASTDHDLATRSYEILDVSRLAPLPSPGLRILREPRLQSMMISFRRNLAFQSPANLCFPPGLFQSPLAFQVFLAPAGSAQLADWTAPLRSGGQPPARASLLLAFRDTLPAFTPAQAMRRWDGAHTGPSGGRHGLYNLLLAAQDYRIPVVLLDLKTPASLSALDYLKGSQLVSRLASLGVLVLPEVAPGYTGVSPPEALVDGALRYNRQVALSLEQASAFSLYSPAGVMPQGGTARVVFLPNPSVTPGSPVSVLEQAGQQIIRVPAGTELQGEDLQLDGDGLTLETRRWLAQAASSQDVRNNSSMVVLGGSLPDVAWGERQAARSAFHYIASHPWIHVLDANALIAMDGAAMDGAAMSGTASQDAVLVPTNLSAAQPSSRDRLASDPLSGAFNLLPAGKARDPLARAAWMSALALYAPVHPASPDLALLRSRYTDQSTLLLAARAWSQCPFSTAACSQAPVTSCQEDIDGDGESECVLASSRLLAVFELHGGYLSNLFWRDSHGEPHQVIAPSYELLSGLSEPSTWDLSRGLAADPSVLPGAFYEPGAFPGDPPDLSALYSAHLDGYSLELVAPDGSRHKTFHLRQDGIQAWLQTASPGPASIFLVVDPWLRFSHNWANRYSGETASDSHSFTWQVNTSALRNGRFPPGPSLRVVVSASQPLEAHAFSEANPYIGPGEDPNRDYPPGHFLPLSSAIVQVTASGDTTIAIHIDGD